MNIEDYKALAQPCIRDTPPPCACACPLGLDVRAFMDKLHRGNFTAAYRLYRNHALFPAIVSRICPQPCQEACVRAAQGQALHVRALEAACVALTQKTTPIAYNVPPKPFSVAIIGAGLSGLACALKLAARNYQVRLYEREAQPGGRLRQLLPPQVYLSDIDLQFSEADCQRVFGTAVEDLDALEAHAVYIATGEGGEDFGLRAGMNPESLGSVRPGVFLGGGLLGAAPMEALAHGVRASYSLEKFLQTGAMDGVPATYARPQAAPSYYRLLLPPAPPAPEAAAPGSDLNAEAAQAESLRCPGCNCAVCYDACELMQTCKSYPPRLVNDAVATLGPRENITQRVGMKAVNACFLCGLCRDICPESVDMERCFLEARRSLHLDKVMPPAYHDFWLRDMDFSNTRAAFLHTPSVEHRSGKAAWCFFPGCQLGASDPAYVTAAHAALTALRPDTALLSGCCGIPADWAGDEALRDSVLDGIRAAWETLGRPRFVLACPACGQTFRRYLPDLPTLSLYALLAGPEYAPIPLAPMASPPADGTVAIHDPCTSRRDPEMQGSLRQLLQRAGLALEELPDSGPQAHCCGFGGHGHAVLPLLPQEAAARRVAQSEREYVTYCANCRDSFAAAGKDCRHVLDLLFTGNEPRRAPPSLTQRRRNRLRVKAHFVGSEVREEESASMKLRIAPELTDKMNRLLILEDEVAEVIARCEAEGTKLFSPASGRFTGYRQLGPITYWVEYTPEGDEFLVHNVYSHRMTIEPL